MKKLILAAVATAVGSVFGGVTRNVPTDGDLATVVGAAQSGDEVVIAASETPYELAAALTVPAGVTVRGATGDWKDVVLRMTVTGARAVTLSENATLSAVTVTGAEYQSSGAGVYIAAAGALLENCRVTGCKSAIAANGNYTPAGGAVANNGGTVRGCVIDGNGRASTGATQHGPIAYHSLAAGALMENCVITNNVEQFGQSGGTLAKSNGYSGMVLMNAGTMRYTLIADNDAGPITVEGTTAFGTAVALISATVEHCTIVRNRYYAGWRRTNLVGAMCYNKSNTFSNNIVAGNGAWGETEYDDLYLPAGVTAENNMTGCLSDLGPGDVSLPATAIAELGAYPSDETGFVCSFSASEWAPVGLKTVWLSPNVAGASGSCTYEWDLDGDGVYETPAGAHIIPFEPTATGVHLIGLRVTSGGASTTFEAAIDVRQGVFFVDDSSANPTPPYATEETAATSVNDALALAQGVPGSEVRILTGNYPLSAMLNISRCVRVVGVGATRDDVVLTAPSAARAAKLTGFGACLSNLTVKGLNSIDASGAGIYAENGALVTNCRVTEGAGTGRLSGYAIYNDGATVTRCTIDGLTMSNYIQGMYYQAGAVAFADRLIVTNISSSCGWSNGGSYKASVAIWQAGGEIRNAFVADNRQTAGPSRNYVNGIFVQIDGGRFVNSTVIDNSSAAAKAADDAGEYSIPVYAAAAAAVTNCLFAGNMMGNFEHNTRTQGTQPFSYCCAPSVDNFTGEGNIVLDEGRYVRTADGFYAFETSGVCVDRGASLDWSSDDLDLVGKSRLAGLGVDIGAIELQRKSFDASFSAPAYSALGALETTLTASVLGDVTGVVYSWDLDGDGIYETVGADKATVPLSLATPCQVTVSLQVTNAKGEETTDAHDFTVYPEVVWYDSASTAPAWPYDSLATAAATIEEALGAAIVGATVKVAQGDHAMTGEVTVPAGVTVRGATGDHGDVTVRGTKSARVFHLVGAGATLADLTVTDLPSAGVNGGGVWIEGGTLQNCRLTGSTTSGDNTKGVTTYGYAILNQGGQVIGCRIDDLTATGNYYGVGIHQSGEGALTDRCVFEDLTTTWWQNGSAYPSCLVISASGGVIRNTLVRNNTITVKGTQKDYDLGAFIQLNGSARAENCTVVENVLPTEKTGYENHTQPVFTAGTSALVNCLVLSNTIAGVQRSWKSTGANFDHCCTTDAAELAGEGNVEGTARTYRTKRDGRLVLIPASPCVDAGDDLAWTATGLDLYGKTRKTGRHVDIGAVEGGYGGLMLMLK